MAWGSVSPRPGLLHGRLSQPWPEVHPGVRGSQWKEHLTGSQEKWNLTHLTTNKPLGCQKMEEMLWVMGALLLAMLKQRWLATAQNCWGKEPSSSQMVGPSSLKSSFQLNISHSGYFVQLYLIHRIVRINKMMYRKILDYCHMAWECVRLCSSYQL